MSPKKVRCALDANDRNEEFVKMTLAVMTSSEYTDAKCIKEMGDPDITVFICCTRLDSVPALKG